jgi:hypothetical protein
MEPFSICLRRLTTENANAQHHSPRLDVVRFDKPKSLTRGATKIDRCDPPLTTVVTAYPAPTTLGALSPTNRVGRPATMWPPPPFDRRIDFAAIRFAVLAR